MAKRPSRSLQQRPSVQRCNEKDYDYRKPEKNALKAAKSTKKRTLKVTWKWDAKATGYQVVIAQNKTFKKGKKTALIKKNKNTSRIFKKLKGRTNYYCKVRAYKQVGKTKIYGAYSKTKRIKVK